MKYSFLSANSVKLNAECYMVVRKLVRNIVVTTIGKDPERVTYSEILVLGRKFEVRR